MTIASESISEVKIKTCKSGLHTFTGRRCNECSRKRDAEYRAANPDKVRAAVSAWFAANPEKVKKSNATYRSKNKEKVDAYHSAYRAANSERLKSVMTDFRSANPEKIRLYGARYREKNNGKIRIHRQNRRARKKSAYGDISKGLAERLFELQKGKCACCGKSLGDNYHMDHIMPLALGGSNTDDNIQLLTPRCNMQKSAKDPIEFMQQRGFLL